MSVNETDNVTVIAVVEAATDTQLAKVIPANPATGSNPVPMTPVNIRDVALAWRDGWPSIEDAMRPGVWSTAGNANDWRRKYRPVVGSFKALSKEQIRLVLSRIQEEAALRALPLGVALQVTQTGLSVEFGIVRMGGNRPSVYSWNFGDGATSTDAAPTHVYAQAGMYSVILQAEDPDAETCEATISVTVQE